MLVFYSEHCRCDTRDGLPQWPLYPTNAHDYSIHYEDLPVSVLLSLALVSALKSAMAEERALAMALLTQCTQDQRQNVL